jgi:hypothetical protein
MGKLPGLPSRISTVRRRHDQGCDPLPKWLRKSLTDLEVARFKVRRPDGQGLFLLLLSSREPQSGVPNWGTVALPGTQDGGSRGRAAPDGAGARPGAVRIPGTGFSPASHAMTVDCMVRNPRRPWIRSPAGPAGGANGTSPRVWHEGCDRGSVSRHGWTRTQGGKR